MSSDTLAPAVDLKIGEETFQLCFTFGALQDAKRILRKEGIRMNILLALDSFDVDVDALPALLYGALRTHHPEISYETVVHMLDPLSAHRAFGAVCEAYVRSVRGSAGEQAADPQPGPKE